MMTTTPPIKVAQVRLFNRREIIVTGKLNFEWQYKFYGESKKFYMSGYTMEEVTKFLSGDHTTLAVKRTNIKPGQIYYDKEWNVFFQTLTNARKSESNTAYLVDILLLSDPEDSNKGSIGRTFSWESGVVLSSELVSDG